MPDTPPRTLVVICGPPAVGKMTVGVELSALTGLPLFHNHLSIEAVVPVFGFGTAPFGRLVTGFRRSVFTEVAESDLAGIIFTYVWAFDIPEDRQFIEDIAQIFTSRGGRTVFAELQADLQTRIERNASPDRLAAKSSKRNLESSQENLLHVDQKYKLNSEDDFPLPNHLLLDNTSLSAPEAARRIADHFDLPRISTRSPRPLGSES